MPRMIICSAVRATCDYASVKRMTKRVPHRRYILWVPDVRSTPQDDSGGGGGVGSAETCRGGLCGRGRNSDPRPLDICSPDPCVCSAATTSETSAISELQSLVENADPWQQVSPRGRPSRRQGSSTESRLLSWNPRLFLSSRSRNQ